MSDCGTLSISSRGFVATSPKFAGHDMRVPLKNYLLQIVEIPGGDGIPECSIAASVLYLSPCRFGFVTSSSPRRHSRRVRRGIVRARRRGPVPGERVGDSLEVSLERRELWIRIPMKPETAVDDHDRLTYAE
jgi:hypothetical protein